MRSLTLFFCNCIRVVVDVDVDISTVGCLLLLTLFVCLCCLSLGCPYFISGHVVVLATLPVFQLFVPSLVLLVLFDQRCSSWIVDCGG